MRFEPPLIQGTFQKRYKRFFTDIEHKGEVITAHCPNTGSMMGLKDEGAPCLFSTTDDPKRKLKHTLQMIKSAESWVGVNTGLPNKLVVELFQESPLDHWQDYDAFQSEVKINSNSRIDLVFWSTKDHNVKKWNPKNLQPPMRLIEIKNVTLAEDGVAMFPDAVTTRGQKHLEELMHFKDLGFDCEMIFVIQRTDCTSFAPARHIDSNYADKLALASQKGVKITALSCSLTPREVKLLPKQIPIQL